MKNEACFVSLHCLSAFALPTSFNNINNDLEFVSINCILNAESLMRCSNNRNRKQGYDFAPREMRSIS